MPSTPPYSLEFRREAVRLLRTSGRSVPQLVRELGCSPQSKRVASSAGSVRSSQTWGCSSTTPEPAGAPRRLSGSRKTSHGGYCYTALVQEARRQIAALSKATATDTGSPAKGYHAAKRVAAHGTGGNDWTAVHEAEGDLPLCNLRKHFERMAVEDPMSVQLGPGLADCGHCAKP